MIGEIIKEREIKEVFHFTTLNGLIGILYSKALMSRRQVNVDEEFEYILLNNCDSRRDEEWDDYISLSISRINTKFFEYSRRNHREVEWVVLSFKSDILAHEGLVFSTSNNVYPASLRSEGASGLNAMFNDRVEWGYYGSVKRRPANLDSSFTTDLQAEVLYPSSLQIEHLNTIYVESEDSIDKIKGIMEALKITNISIINDSAMFKGR